MSRRKGTVRVPGLDEPRNPLTAVRLLREGLALVALLVLVPTLDPSGGAWPLGLTVALWTAGWGFWTWRDHRAWRHHRSRRRDGGLGPRRRRGKCGERRQPSRRASVPGRGQP